MIKLKDSKNKYAQIRVVLRGRKLSPVTYNNKKRFPVKGI